MNDPRHLRYDPYEPGVPEAVKQAIDSQELGAEEAELAAEARYERFLEGG